MFLRLFLLKRRRLLFRGFHAGKHFSNPSNEDIVFRAICVNLRQKKWKLLEQMSPCISSSLVNRVVCEFQRSPHLALEFYNWVGERKVDPPLECCCTVIHVLVGLRRFDDALTLMRDLMCAKGATPSEVLEGLVGAYKMFDLNPAVFDALVRACTQVGATEGAYEVIKRLMKEGCWVTIHAWNNFLNHLLKLNEISRFWKMYKEMISYRYIENVNSFNLVIYALCKECKLQEAISVFYQMLKSEIWPNVVTFNMMVDCASKMGEMELALKLVRKIGVMSGECVKPNSVTYNCLIYGFCSIGSVAVAEEIRNEMTKAGIEPNVRTYATLIDGYARGGSLDEALMLSDEMIAKGIMPNVVVYNSFFHWLFMEGDVGEASLLFSDMIDKGIGPDQFTCSTLTKGLCRNGFVGRALKFHKENLEMNLVKDTYCHNILINYMCRRRDLTGAKQLLGSMFVQGFTPDLVTYGTLIDGYCKEGNVESAIQVYENMIKVERKSNLVIYNSVVNGLCKVVSVDAAKLLVDALQETSEHDAMTYNTLLNGYCMSGRTNEAFTTLFKMIKAGILLNTVTYNILIHFLCKCGLIGEAKELIEAMILQGVVPDSITYTTVITSVNKMSSADEVIELHDYMVLRGVIPDMHTYRDIVSLML